MNEQRRIRTCDPQDKKPKLYLIRHGALLVFRCYLFLFKRRDLVTTFTIIYIKGEDGIEI